MSDVKPRLFVDCQVFQYNTWNRGMGRYSLKLLEAIDKEGNELILILNKNIPLEKNRLQAIKKACPAARIIFLRLSEDPNRFGGWKQLHAVCQQELDKQLATELRPEDTYLIASNFAIRYCSTFPSLECKKAVIFYDLTPYLQWGDFKKTPDFEPKKYFAQFKTIFDADQLWAISESAADEAKYWLGIDSAKVINIRGASIRNLEEKKQPPKSAPHSKFLICPSADSPHKNNENMVRAFAEFNARINNQYKLVITSDFSSQSRAALSALSHDLIFAGHVTDGELGWLYENCEALLFVSKNEGLGLPILEAVEAGKKVICSEITVFREISDEAFYFADPNNVSSIVMALEKALINSENWDAKKELFAEISQKFSWPTIAKICWQLTEAPVKTIESSSTIAFWYADSDQYSISRDVAELLYPLNPGAEYYCMRPLKYEYNFPSYLLDMGVATHALDESSSTLPTYIVDDSEQGGQLLLRALRSPGKVITMFSDAQPPKQIEVYLKHIFEEHVSYDIFKRLLERATNTIIYAADFSARGNHALITEVNKLNKDLQQKEF